MEQARHWLPRGLGIVAFLAYALTTEGLLTPDSAELTASAAWLGIPRASGFPVYVLVAKLASFLPIGELAFRISLLSSLCAAFAVAGTARFILNLGSKDWGTVAGAVAGALVLALSLGLTRHATVADVYAPTAAWIVLSLILYQRVAAGAPASAGLALAWVAGLGFGLHGSYRLLMGLPILALFTVRLRRGARWPLLAPMISALSAFAVYLYLPLRSASGRITGLDSGQPQTLEAAFEHGTAGELFSSLHNRVGPDFALFVERLGDRIGLLCILAALAGLAVLLRDRQNRWVAFPLLCIVLLDTVFGVWANPLGLGDWQAGVPLMVGACIAGGVGVSSLARMTGPGVAFVGAVAAMLVVAQPALLVLTSGTPVGSPRSGGAEVYLQTVEGLRAHRVLAGQSQDELVPPIRGYGKIPRSP